jgi:glutathione S-transferase
MTAITITGFRQVPDFARGLVRDMRPRWTLKELGQPYAVRLIEQGERDDDAFRAMQPFGLIPTMTSAGDSIFESGAIVVLLAEGTPLMGATPSERAATLAWIFAALNTVEPYITLVFANDHGRADKPWTGQARDDLTAVIDARLAVLEKRLAGQDYLVSDFGAADIVMVTTLRFLAYTDILSRYPAVAAYVARCEARPAFQAALADHLAQLDPPAMAA